MKKVVVDAELQARLQGLTEQLFLADAAGHPLGVFLPREVYAEMVLAWMSREPTPEELEASREDYRKHGGKTVFIARFVAILRFTAALLAGATRMHWWKFFFWNAAGGICWATGVGLLAYYGGKAAAEAFDTYGLIGAGAIVGLLALALFGAHVWRKRMVEE